MRIALGVEYDGAAYFGWQRQKQHISVQAVVEQALSTVAAHPITITCAGRTDTGVHAAGQVIHFDTDAERPLNAWVRGSNANLPKDVNICWAQQVSDSFHARFDASARHYRYTILNQSVPSAIRRHFVTWHPYSLDADAMKAGAQYLLGEHDFTSFRGAGCQAHSPIRHLTRLDVARAGNEITLEVSANAFLHHMVRNIAGTLMAVGQGDYPPQWVAEVLAARDRKQAGMTAKASGLCLVGVDYPNLCQP